MNPVIKILILSTVSFGVAIVLTPFWVRFLEKYKLGKQIRTEGAPIFALLHMKKAGTPTTILLQSFSDRPMSRLDLQPQKR